MVQLKQQQQQQVIIAGGGTGLVSGPSEGWVGVTYLAIPDWYQYQSGGVGKKI